MYKKQLVGGSRYPQLDAIQLLHNPETFDIVVEPKLLTPDYTMAFSPPEVTFTASNWREYQNVTASLISNGQPKPDTTSKIFIEVIGVRPTAHPPTLTLIHNNDSHAMSSSSARSALRVTLPTPPG